jgi:hypothetical protein
MLIARALKSHYGWPDDFSADAWEETVSTVCRSAEDWEDWLAPPSEKRVALLRRWRSNPEEIIDLFEAESPS